MHLTPPPCFFCPLPILDTPDTLHTLDTLLSLVHNIPECPSNSQLIIAAYLLGNSLSLPANTVIITSPGKSTGYLQNTRSRVAEWAIV